MAGPTFPPSTPPVWQGGGTVWCIDNLMANPVFDVGNIPTAQEPNGQGTSIYPPGQWNAVDLKPWGVPSNAAWADLQAIFIITHAPWPNNVEENLTLAISKAGNPFNQFGGTDPAADYYIGQAACPGPASSTSPSTGIRQNFNTSVQLVNGIFWAWWDYVERGTANQVWNATSTGSSAVGINLKLQRIGMPDGTNPNNPGALPVSPPPPPPPTNTGSTFSAANKTSGIILSGANMMAAKGSSGFGDEQALSTSSHSSGKFHVEFVVSLKASANTGDMGVGLASFAHNLNTSNWLGLGASIGWYGGGGVYINGAQVFVSSALQFQQWNTLAMEIDFGAGLFWLMNASRSSSWVGPFSLGSLSAASLFTAVDIERQGDGITMNFGASAFLAPMSAGYSAWG